MREKCHINMLTPKTHWIGFSKALYDSVTRTCNLLHPYKYFTIHLPHAQQWNVP